MKNENDLNYEKTHIFFSRYFFISLLIGLLGCLCISYIDKKICNLGEKSEFGSILDGRSLIVFSPDKNLSFDLEIKKDLDINGVTNLKDQNSSGDEK